MFNISSQCLHTLLNISWCYYNVIIITMFSGFICGWLQTSTGTNISCLIMTIIYIVPYIDANNNQNYEVNAYDKNTKVIWWFFKNRCVTKINNNNNRNINLYRSCNGAIQFVSVIICHYYYYFLLHIYHIVILSLLYVIQVLLFMGKY